MNLHIDKLGKPQIDIAGLKLWVHSYQYRDAADYDDANWLNATAICSDRGATVLIRGAFVRTTEIFDWQRAVEEFAETLADDARLECMEPELAVTLTAMSLGAVEMEVQITPAPLSQEHKFTFAIDRSYLGPLASQCANLLDSFPIRG